MMLYLEGGKTSRDMVLNYTERLHSSSFSRIPYRILNINHKMELLWSLWVIIRPLYCAVFRILTSSGAQRGLQTLHPEFLTLNSKLLTLNKTQM